MLIGKKFTKYDFYWANNIFQHNFLVEYQLKYQHDHNWDNMTHLDKPF